MLEVERVDAGKLRHDVPDPAAGGDQKARLDRGVVSEKDPSGERRKDPLDSRLLVEAEARRVVGDAVEDRRVAHALRGRAEQH